MARQIRCAPIEVHSAIQRLVRQGDLSLTEALAAQSSLRAEVQQCTVLPLDENVLASAEIIIQQLPLRTLVALQLAPLAANKLQAIYFLAANRKLLSAAQTAGLLTIAAQP